MVRRFGSMYMVRRGYTKHQLVSWLDEQERKVELLPFGQSHWDYLPDLVRDNILKMVEDQLILEAKDKQNSNETGVLPNPGPPHVEGIL